MPRGALALIVGAPLLVVVALQAFHNVFAVFLLYHVGLCLVVPAVLNLLVRRRGWTGHLAALGLGGRRRGPLLAGGGLGLLLAAAVTVFFAVWRGALPDAADLRATLAAWGAGPDRLAALVVFMCLVNGPAEELFWRGHLAAELAGWRRRRAALLVPSLGYASYHAVTVYLLAGRLDAAAVMLLAVLGAGLGWAWLRERTGSVLPAIVSHAAATCAYMAAAWPILDV